MENKENIAKEISFALPMFMRYMHPYIFGPMEAPPAQILTLVAIEEKGICTLTQLRKETRVSAPTISGIIDRLVKSGFIKRSSDPKDRRVKNVVLTKKGKKLLLKFRKNIKNRWEYVLDKIPAAIGDSMVVGLREMTKRFKDGIL